MGRGQAEAATDPARHGQNAGGQKTAPKSDVAITQMSNSTDIDCNQWITPGYAAGWGVILFLAGVCCTSFIFIAWVEYQLDEGHDVIFRRQAGTGSIIIKARQEEEQVVVWHSEP